MGFVFLGDRQEPGKAFFKDARVQGVNDELPVFFRENQVGLLQQIEMVRNGRLADGKAAGDFAGGHVPPAQLIENRASRRVVQGFEQLVHNVSIFRQ